MRRIGDNEAITISWRKFTPDFMRKLDEKVQDDRHPTTSFGQSITIQYSSMELSKCTFPLKFCGRTIRIRAFFPELVEKTYFADQNL
jgi:hypothetical protein